MKLLEPRETRTGKVTVEWDPISTLHAELDSRYARLIALREKLAAMKPNDEAVQVQADMYVARAECHGIAVGISVLRCETLEDIAKQAHERYLGFRKSTA